MPASSNIEGCLFLPANLTLRTITATHTDILACLADHDGVEIAFEDEMQVDLSFLQLMESARIQAARSGKAISLSQPASGALLDALRRAGFLEGMTAEDAQFWLHQGEKQ